MKTYIGFASIIQKTTKSISWVHLFAVFTWLIISASACINISPSAHNPTMEIFVTAFMADLRGTLIEEDGCVRVKDDRGKEFTLVWPPDLRLIKEGNLIRIESGLVSGLYNERIFHIGDMVELAGGFVGQPDEQLMDTIPANCPGPYWVVGSNLTLLTQTPTP